MDSRSSADWSELRYTTRESETPTLLVGIETKAADYMFSLNAAGDGDGQVIILALDIKKGFLAIHSMAAPRRAISPEE